MSIDSKHPSYADAYDEWISMRDFYAGEKTVKSKGERYLPATSGMVIDGMDSKQAVGFKDYEAYKKRAVVPDYVSEAVEILVGLLHQKDPTIELPDAMKPLMDHVTVNGESLLTLIRRVNVEQLITGRLGLLADLPSVVIPGEAPLPYIALYAAESIINWDDHSETDGYNALNMVVLDESRMSRVNAFEWRQETRYRVLQLGVMEKDEPNGTVVYKQGVFSNLDSSSIAYNEEEMKAPIFKGKTLEYIPFAFINSKDILATPDKPPLRGLQEICESLYRMEADYRQNLHMQAQDTLVVVGGVRTTDSVPGQPDVLRTGAGSRIDVDVGGDAKYIGVSSLGLGEQRQAIENDKKRATIKAGELIQSGGSQQESGLALQTRFTAQTATLNQIALSGARGVENILKAIAEWVGADPKKVKITPNTEFTDFGLDGLNFVQIMTAKSLGLPISLKSIHAVMADRGMTTLDFDTEVKEINAEVNLLPKTEISSNPAAAGIPNPKDRGIKNEGAKKPAAQAPAPVPPK